MTLRVRVCPCCDGAGDVLDQDGITRVCGECMGSGRVYVTAPFPELGDLNAARRLAPTTFAGGAA